MHDPDAAVRGQEAELNDLVERWETLSDSQKKGYYRRVIGSDRKAVPEYFDLDTETFEFLDKSWKVEGTGNWEIRSVPFESMEEAAERMREVKRLTGTSGKGFHLHMRDNNPNRDMLKQRASEFADFIDRSANWIWLERAMRMGTMTSIKSWSNSRIGESDLKNLAELSSSSRATVRVTFPYEADYVDLEIRGLTKWVDDIERLGKIYTEAMRTGNFGPWKHTANPLPNGGQGEAPESLQLSQRFEEYLREVEGKELTPEMRKVIEGLQNDYVRDAKGSSRAYQTNVATALLPWHNEEALSEPLRRTLKFKQEEFLRGLRFTAEKVMNGAYGLDLSVASPEALAEHLGLTEAEAEVIRTQRAAGATIAGAEGGAEGLVRALALGADAARAGRLDELDLRDADARALQDRLDLSEQEAKNLVDFRESHEVEEALARQAKLSPEAIAELVQQARGLDISLSDVSAEAIARFTGLPLKAASKIVSYREANTVDNEASLKAAGLTAPAAPPERGLRRHRTRRAGLARLLVRLCLPSRVYGARGARSRTDRVALRSALGAAAGRGADACGGPNVGERREAHAGCASAQRVHTPRRAVCPGGADPWRPLQRHGCAGMSGHAGPPLDFDAPVESIDEFVEYLRGGEKPPEHWRIGTEHEKIGLHGDDRAPVPYEGERGIGALLEAIAEADGWERIREDGNVIALAKEGASITLEPGGQLELSGAPLRSIHQTCDEFHQHLALMEARE